MSGIYFLLDGKTIVYVGQTISIQRRIKEHKRNKTFTSFRFIKCNRGIDYYERRWIELFRPKYNMNSGRPKMAQNEKKQGISLKLRPILISRIKAESKRRGTTVSRLVESCILNDIPKLETGR